MKPVSAIVLFSDGTSSPVDAKSVADVFDAATSLATRRKSFQTGESDEGYKTGYKPLAEIGGRTEFERSMQRRTIDKLKNAERAGLKRVLLIGDSIRMRRSNGTGYGMHVYRRLLGKVNLTHIPHNCGATAAVQDNLLDWLSCKPDIVHINAGLHDLSIISKDVPEAAGRTSIKDYQDNLRAIFRTMIDRSIAVIWAFNTPVDDEWHLTDRYSYRRNSDVIAYNEASREVAGEFGIPVNDLYTPLFEAGVRTVLVPDGVHINHKGAAIAGKCVADAILAIV